MWQFVIYRSPRESAVAMNRATGEVFIVYSVCTNSETSIFVVQSIQEPATDLFWCRMNVVRIFLVERYDYEADVKAARS